MDLTIDRISFKNFRSYELFELSNLGALTVFVGPNAVGKTNIIEGIQLLTAMQSFRHPTFDQIIREGSTFACLEADLTDGNRDLNFSLRLNEGKRQYFLNGKSKRTSDLKGIIPSVTFTPDDLGLVKGSSGPRRAAIDALGSQLSVNHYVIKKDYEKVLRYKNRLLKEEASPDLIASINETLVTCGAQLSYYRAALFEKLIPMVKSYYAAIVAGHEDMELCYIPSWETHDQAKINSFFFNRNEARGNLECALSRFNVEERARKRAVIGPHADHIEFFINQRNAGIYGSQGQQRSLVLAFKLAEASLIQEVLHQKPILLLDDVMSELDASRRNALISFIEGDIQTFITTTNLAYFDQGLLNKARVIKLAP